MPSLHLLLALTVAFAVSVMYPRPATALEWVCAAPHKSRVAMGTADADDFTLAGLAAPKKRETKSGKSVVDQFDLQQAYTGTRVLLSSGHWLVVVMLPASHPDTALAFSSLGLGPSSAKDAERLAASGLVDYGIRIAHNSTDMLNQISVNPYAIGFTTSAVGLRDVAPCF